MNGLPDEQDHLVQRWPLIAFLDANILFSKTLRDWLCRTALLSEGEVLRVRWSDDVLAEWVYRARRQQPQLSDEGVSAARRHLLEAFPDALVTGYDPMQVAQPQDVHDWHVLAAAEHGRCDVLVTSDAALLEEPVEGSRVRSATADAVLVAVAGAHGDVVETVLADQQSYWRRRGAPAARRDLAHRLGLAGAPRFAALVVGDEP